MINTTEQNEQLLLMYRRVRELHRDIFSLSDRIQTDCRREASAGPVVDAVFVLKKTVQYIEGSRKEINKALDLLQRLGCLLAMQTEDNGLRGQLASGHASNSQQVLLPDREADPAAYTALMNAIGAPDMPTIRPSFSGIEAFATKLANEGKPLPPGLEHARTVDKFTVTARARGSIDLDIEADAVHKGHASPTLSLDDITVNTARVNSGEIRPNPEDDNPF